MVVLTPARVQLSELGGRSFDERVTHGRVPLIIDFSSELQRALQQQPSSASDCGASAAVQCMEHCRDNECEELTSDPHAECGGCGE